MPPAEAELELPTPLDDVSEVPPAAELPLAAPGLLKLPDVLDEPDEPEEVPLPGEVEVPPVAPAEPPALLSDRMAKSIRPELGLTMKSLIVPICVPELLVTCAPVSWLPRIS